MRNRYLLVCVIFVCLLLFVICDNKEHRQTLAELEQVKDAQSQTTTKLQSETRPVYGSSYFQTVKITSEIQAACSSAIAKMDHCYVGHGDPANTMDEAQRLLWNNFSIQLTYSPKSCIEFNGWFLVSHFNTAGQDDGSFKSGMAVKKGTTEMYPW